MLYALVGIVVVVGVAGAVAGVVGAAIGVVTFCYNSWYRLVLVTGCLLKCC